MCLFAFAAGAKEKYSAAREDAVSVAVVRRATVRVAKSDEVRVLNGLLDAKKDGAANPKPELDTHARGVEPDAGSKTR